MLDLKQGLARSNHFCTSANPLMYKSNGTTCVSPKATDSFDFWGDQRSNKYDRYDHTVGDEEVESFQTRSTPLWKKIRSNNIGGYEISPLLPNNHHYSSPSPTSRLQAIIDGRRELMEMIQDMPESCYELSLKDMVDDHDDDDQVSHHHQGVQVEEEVKKIKPKNKKKRNSTGIRGPISRCESMDSGVFLLKMFFPISLSSKKKSTSKLSRRSSFEGSEKPVHKDWWKMGFSSAGESKSSARSTSSSSRSSSSNSNSNSSSRSAGNNFTSSRWSFPIKKCKSTGQPGCFF